MKCNFPSIDFIRVSIYPHFQLKIRETFISLDFCLFEKQTIHRLGILVKKLIFFSLPSHAPSSKLKSYHTEGPRNDDLFIIYPIV